MISAKRSLRFARAGVEGRVLELERIGEGEGGPIGRSTEVESWLSATGTEDEAAYPLV